MATNTGLNTAASYGITEALLATYPELKSVYELFKNSDEGAALEALFKTNYYRTSNSTVKSREKQKLEQPQVYADSVTKYKLAARKRLVDSGIQIDTTTFDILVEDAYAKGLDDNQLDQAIATSGKITGFGGNILGDTTTLKSYANSYGVNQLLNDSYWTQKSKDLFAGTVTANDIEKEIRTLSASAYPAYGEQILAGVSFDSQTSNVKQSMATWLEVDPETITNDDKTFRMLTQWVNPNTGKPEKMPQWLVEKTIKSTPEWGFTKNALSTLDSLADRVLKQEWKLA
jgi:hypothetical protein